MPEQVPPLPAASPSCCSDSSESPVTVPNAARGNKLTSWWGSGPAILRIQRKKRKLKLQTTAVNCSPKVRLYGLAYKCKKKVPRLPCKMRTLQEMLLEMACRRKGKKEPKDVTSAIF